MQTIKFTVGPSNYTSHVDKNDKTYLNLKNSSKTKANSVITIIWLLKLRHNLTLIFVTFIKIDLPNSIQLVAISDKSSLDRSSLKCNKFYALCNIYS